MWDLLETMITCDAVSYLYSVLEDYTVLFTDSDGDII